MPRASKVCSVKGCTNVTRSGRCEECRGEAEQQRGTAAQRGYGQRHRRSFRSAVLERDPFCTCKARDHAGHLGRRCVAPSTVADHYPLSRRQLEQRGLDPDDPAHGRGLCKACHDAHTAQAQPGGWNR